MRKLFIIGIILQSVLSIKLYAQKIEINPFGFCDDIKGYEYVEALLKPDSVIDLGIGNEYLDIPTLKIDSLKLLQFKSLRLLRIGNFYLDTLNMNDLSKLDLLVLYITECRINAIPDEIFNNRNLEYICLNQNNIKAIPKKIRRLKNLSRFLIWSNQIESIPYRQLKKLKHLIEFNIWDNPILEDKSQEKKLNKLYKKIDKRRVKQGIPKLYTVKPIDE